jgi:hypothetical protein
MIGRDRRYSLSQTVPSVSAGADSVVSTEAAATGANGTYPHRQRSDGQVGSDRGPGGSYFNRDRLNLPASGRLDWQLLCARAERATLSPKPAALRQKYS